VCPGTICHTYEKVYTITLEYNYYTNIVLNKRL
jgi:hypothetical protein